MFKYHFSKNKPPNPKPTLKPPQTSINQIIS